MSHHSVCSLKQSERARQFSALKYSHSAPLTEQEEHSLALSLADIVTSCSTGVIKPSVVRDAFLKRTVTAHEATNCISEFLQDNHLNPHGSHSTFLGVPISIKDSFDIRGYDTTMGYARRSGCPAKSSSVIVDMLLSAGATLHVKTTVPTGLLDLETSSDLFGYTTNPYSPHHSVGASTGGGAALLAYRGSIIEVGSDIGGSVRIPAHFCGIYSLKASLGRFPQTGSATCTPGLQTIHAVTSPMAGNLDDLEEFCRRFVDLSPWKFDHTCVPVPWRPFQTENKTFKFGVIWDDGIVPPSPACLRALNMVVDALKQQGHEVVDFYPPSPLDGLKLGYRSVFTTGATASFKPLNPGERINDAMKNTKLLLNLPLFVKQFLAILLRTFSKPRGRNDSYASLLEVLHPCNCLEEREIVVARDRYLVQWQSKWNAANLDFVLTVPFAVPAIPKGSCGKASLMAATYCFLYNVLDYTTGILPVTFVNKQLDALPPNFEQSAQYLGMSDVSQGIYKLYDAESMDGLPVGVQVVGLKFQEEKVLAGMKVVRAALAAVGTVFKSRFF